ncbi:MAG: InlB B-repeat-containing protein [Candidatus Natronoplasma sp.]
MIRIIAIAIAAVILLGSLSIWAVSTQEYASVGVGDIYEVDIASNENLTDILNTTSGSSGDIEENKKLFDVDPNSSYPRDSITGSLHLYNAGEVEKYLNSLKIEMKAKGKTIGNLTLNDGQLSFRIEKNGGWDQFSVNTTGRGSYTRKPDADEFDLHFMVQIDEVQEGVISHEDIRPVMVELDISSTDGGNVAEPGEGTFQYEKGTVIDLEAVADQNSPFVEWTGDNSTIDNTTSNKTTIEMLDNYTITAVFDVVTYELSVSSTAGGNVTEPGEGTYLYSEGEIVDLEAVADTGYHFVGWTGDNGTIDDTIANQTTIEMLDDYTITAEFEPIIFELTLDSTSGGNVTEPGEGTFTYHYGTRVDLEAIADPDNSFLEWSGENSTVDDTTANQTTIEMLDNYTLTAVFNVNTYDLTIDSTDGGNVTEPGEGTYTYDSGETVSLEAVPDEGYSFVEWTGDNGTIADTTSNQTTIDMLSNYTITAEFSPITYGLTINSTQGGNVTTPGEGTFIYQHGTTVDLEAVADQDSSFIEWSGENGTIADPTSNQTTIEMLENYNITAEFLQEPFFDVQIIDYDDPVIEGQTFVMDYNVTNTGGLEDTQDIVFTVEDQDGNIVHEVIDSGVTLAPGEIYDETFTWTTEEGDAGEYDVTVASEDDEETVTARVYGTAMDIDENTYSYDQNNGEWVTHWEETNVYVEGLNQMDVLLSYELTGYPNPGQGAMAGVRIVVDGVVEEEWTSYGTKSDDWEGTVDVSGKTEVDIQFEYYTENQGYSDSEVTIDRAGYEYVDTTTINSITNYDREVRIGNDVEEMIGYGSNRNQIRRSVSSCEPKIKDITLNGGVIDVHIHR